MGLSAGKCCGFHLRRSGRSAWVALDTILTVQGAPINNVTQSDHITYLGLDFSLKHGLVESEDSLLRELSREAGWATQLGLQFPTTPRKIDSRQRRLKEASVAGPGLTGRRCLGF
ncbi:hypothetical protein J6590_096083 [Homalodisca vitripennis]|nr:hypothetical protein J6590_096083 [Homalodisca vitripennis]